MAAQRLSPIAGEETEFSPSVVAEPGERDVPAAKQPAWFPGPGERFGTRLEHLDWIDEFAANVRPYVRVRLDDGVLIKMPTDVFQLNRTGLMLLGRVLGGEAIRGVARGAGVAEHPERVYQIHTFFCDVRDLLANRLGDGRRRAATRVDTFTGSFTRYPVLSEVAVTYRCNLACTFCYAGCGTPDAVPGNPTREKHRRPWRLWQDTKCWQRRHPKRDPVQAEMTTGEVCRVIDAIALDAKVPSLSFTGGECTLRSDLPELIAHARGRNLRVNIITNGVRCASRAYVDRLVEAGLTSAQVSVEGPTAVIHDRLAQRPGSFEKTVLGIRNLRDAGLHVHTNTTICRENAGHLTGIVDLARSLDLPHVSMNQLIPTGTPNLPRHRRMQISYTEVGDHILRVRDHAEGIGIGFHWYSPTPFCIFNPVAHGLGNKGCAACDGLLHVSPSGEVLPCSSFARGVGNLLEDAFDTIWFGHEAQYYKRKRQAPRACRRCEHFALCQGACTLYWSAVGCDELRRAAAESRRASRTAEQPTEDADEPAARP